MKISSLKSLFVFFPQEKIIRILFRYLQNIRTVECVRYKIGFNKILIFTYFVIEKMIKTVKTFIHNIFPTNMKHKVFTIDEKRHD